MSATGRGWAYAGALVGAGVSVAANVAHSYVPPAGATARWSPHAGAVVGAVFWPVALLVAIEVLARVAWPDAARWSLLRFGGLVPVAVVAAVVSYRHLSGLLAFYGEDSITSTVGPLAVDGLMVMATGALLATGQATAARTPATRTAIARPRTPATATTADTGRLAATGLDPSPRARGPVSAGKPDTASRIAAVRAAHPDLTAAGIATRLGVSDRTVRRHLAKLTRPQTTTRTVATEGNAA